MSCLLLSVAALVPVIVVVAVAVDMMRINGDAAVGAAADSRAHGRAITAGTDRGDRRDLRYEDAVALGVGRHRVRVAGLRAHLNEDTGAVDHAEHRTAVRAATWTSAGPAGAGVVAIVALVVPDLVRAGQADYICGVLRDRVNDLRGPVGGNVLRGAA